ncbi:ribonucleotide reductase inhibitor-domain-containing protein [Aspergillus alliaceus]|uniref:Ribonucleotide reductase inhibitor-domain-containing protein n=1 Tax=Petromyces alliaceus TaxID=209559 RepID=A0A5N7C8J1_PETAA|nr:ribonucleotide reductase inhibitor-domain-containing protein [Aspergillus alliaceus]
MSSSLHMSKNNNLASKRRRFQPPITSFFPAATESDHADKASAPHLSYTHYSTVTSSPTPAVDAKIQASLLSVGMRVRKSVAEGYKTRNPKSEDKPTLYSNVTPTVRCPTAYAELAPFCGMSKSGGSAIQPTSRGFSLPHNKMDYEDQLITDDGDAFSLPPSSQESIESIHINGQKRSYDRDEDDFDDELDDLSTPWGITWQGPLEPSTRMNSVPGRTILTPALGQQRRQFVAVKTQGTINVDDFEEPAFLRRREEIDMDLS